MTRRAVKKGSGLSVKSRRVLREWGVDKAIAAGARVVPVGRAYELADGYVLRLAFATEEDGRLLVGYTRERDGEAEIVDARPYSARALGYFQRRLKRIDRREGEADDDEGIPL